MAKGRSHDRTSRAHQEDETRGHLALGSVPRRLSRSEQRALVIVALCSLLLGLIATVAMTWDRLFPVAPERLIEVAWTHHCDCVHQWVTALRRQGYVVKDYELTSLNSIRRRWGIPSAASGCHPARFLGLVIDGHLPPEMLRKLAASPPGGVAIVQKQAGHGKGAAFEVVAANGQRSSWP